MEPALKARGELLRDALEHKSLPQETQIPYSVSRRLSVGILVVICEAIWSRMRLASKRQGCFRVNV